MSTETDTVRGQGGEQMAEEAMDANGNMAWQHTNVWANGTLIGTYDNNGLHFYLNDWLGTRRVQTDYEGVTEQTCSSLPYGNGETCTPFPTENLFTGKERDTESGNDYFEARYYASSMGRFLSPDWSAQEEPVPYAKLDDPQSLNLYAYVENNPLARADADGHEGDGCCDFSLPIDGPLMPPLPDPFDPLVPYPDEYTLTPEKLQQGLNDLGDSIVSFFQKIYGAGRKFYPDDKKKIADDANHTCQNSSCGVATVPAQKSAKGVTPPANEGQTDHKKAKSKGGTNHPSNGQHLCRKCNRAKSDSDTPPTPAPPPPPPPPPTPPPTGE